MKKIVIFLLLASVQPNSHAAQSTFPLIGKYSTEIYLFQEPFANITSYKFNDDTKIFIDFMTRNILDGVKELFHISTNGPLFEKIKNGSLIISCVVWGGINPEIAQAFGQKQYYDTYNVVFDQIIKGWFSEQVLKGFDGISIDDMGLSLLRDMSGQEPIRKDTSARFLVGLFNASGVTAGKYEEGYQIGNNFLSPINIHMHATLDGQPFGALSHSAQIDIAKGRNFARFWLFGDLNYDQENLERAVISFNLMPLTPEGVQVFHKIQNQAQVGARKEFSLKIFLNLLEEYAKSIVAPPDTNKGQDYLALLGAIETMRKLLPKASSQAIAPALVELDKDLRGIWAAMSR